MPSDQSSPLNSRNAIIRTTIIVVRMRVIASVHYNILPVSALAEAAERPGWGSLEDIDIPLRLLHCLTLSERLRSTTSLTPLLTL